MKKINKSADPGIGDNAPKSKDFRNKKGGAALPVTPIGRNSTPQVRRHINAGFAGIGTNVSNEKATSLQGAGSTGSTPGKKATDLAKNKKNPVKNYEYWIEEMDFEDYTASYCG